MLTPSDICRNGTEHGHQAALIAWTRLPMVQHFMPKAKRIYACPNGGSRGASQGAMFKAEGVRSGIPDLFLPVPTMRRPGLYIEMKKPGEERIKNGGLSDNQIAEIDALLDDGYEVKVCYSWKEAALSILQYFSEYQYTIDAITEEGFIYER